ncbi:MAG: signal transduction histidine kinase/ligand-binding sensor domain-containing protein [Rhodothermales bacterium]|jgi:signal transduction histidine kinase/ligand-binding sensor domain-containing protein
MIRSAMLTLAVMTLWSATQVAAVRADSHEKIPETGPVPGFWPIGGDELSQVQLDIWTTEDGLPLTAVDLVTQTRDGYLWLGTQEGLVRFDGYDFDVFDKSNSDISSNAIFSIYEDEDGVLWAGTRSGGLLRYFDGVLAQFDLPGLNASSIASIVSDGPGSLLLGLGDSTLVRLNVDESVVTNVGGAEIRGVTSVVRDNSEAIWIGTRENGLFRYGKGVVTSFLATGALDHTYIPDLAIAPDGSIWVASGERGIARIQGYRIHTYGSEAGLPKDAVRSILADPNGTVWVGTEKSGVWRLGGGVVSQPPVLGSARTRAVRDIHFDMEGSVWMATDSGLHRIRNTRFKTYGQGEGLPSNHVQSTIEASDGSVWIGTDAGVARLRQGQIESDFPGVEGQMILSLAESKDGSVWMGTYGSGLFRYRDGVITHRSAESGDIPDNGVFALHSGPSGLWMATRKGAARLTDTGYASLTTEDGLGSNEITAIHETEERDLWLGTYDAGLHLIRNGQVIGRYVSSEFITAIFEDKEGDIWVGTRERGLMLIRKGLTYEFTTAQGLSSDNVLTILEDEDGGIWVTSNIGASRIEKSALLDIAHGRLDRLTPELFTGADGLRSSEFNGGTQPAGWIGSEGRLWLANVAGLVSVNPYQKNGVAPNIVIERFISDSYAGTASTTAVLDAGSKRFEVDFTAPTFLSPLKTSYEFRLEGYDGGWERLAPGAGRTAHYTNLAPGKYTFRVRAQNGDGVWSQQEATLSFELMPFYWQTTWFKVLCPLTILAIFGMAYKGRMDSMRARAAELESQVNERTKDLRLAMQQTEEALTQTEQARQEAEAQREFAETSREVIEKQADQLRDMDRIKTRFFHNISHEFRTPLTLNIGPMENALLGDYGKLTPVLRRQLEVMLRNSRRLLRLINQLLDLSKLESGRMSLKVMEGSLADLVEGIVFSFTPFAEKKELDLTFETTSTTEEFLFDPLGLEKVFFNLLSNAVKFTPDGGSIAVSMEDAVIQKEGQEISAIAIRIRDSGQGIPDSDLQHIFDRFHQVDGAVSKVQEGTGIGLALVKELVELHGGSIVVESVIGEGAEFRVILPTDPCLLGEHEVIVDGYATEPAGRGPMVEMAVFEDVVDGSAKGDEPLTTVSAEAPVVLVVDDSADIREYIAECLQPRYNVVKAIDGQNGFELAQVIRPNLIVSDVMMPKMNGFQLCKAVRGDENIAHIPIVLVTSKASNEDKIEGLEAGADDYVAKPFSARELLARVGNLIRVQDQKNSLERLNTDLLSSNAALRQASEMKSQLLSIASHDMKNPLTAIREFARILREESDQTHQLELLDMIFDSSNDMLSLISQLLDSAALEGGSMHVTRTLTDMVDLAERVVERNVRIADRKGQVIHTTMGDPQACSVPVDGERLREAMDNLVSNAIKYSPLQSSIYVSVKRRTNDVIFSVRDEGPGLTAEDQEKIFGKFQKLSARPTGGETSTGLGLSIVKQVVELHGGRVTADCAETKGSIFTFAIPDVGQATPKDRPPVERTRETDRMGSSLSAED